MVQGVGFRFFAQRIAGRLGLSGYVKILRDGGVEVFAIGRPGQLAALRAELKRGPHSAMVSEVTEEEGPYVPQYADGFSVERDAW